MGRGRWQTHGAEMVSHDDIHQVTGPPRELHTTRTKQVRYTYRDVVVSPTKGALPLNYCMFYCKRAMEI